MQSGENGERHPTHSNDVCFTPESRRPASLSRLKSVKT
jgi:hypothetical protein